VRDNQPWSRTDISMSQISTTAAHPDMLGSLPDRRHSTAKPPTLALWLEQQDCGCAIQLDTTDGGNGHVALHRLPLCNENFYVTK
jgi:hypothetical protein